MRNVAHSSLFVSTRVCLRPTVKRKRIAAASSNLIARKKRESPSAKPYFATTKPELQMMVKIHGAEEATFFIEKLLPHD
jgi:hypothetical protein